MITSGKGPANMLEHKATLDREVLTLLSENDCGGATVARFQENLRRFAAGEEPIVLPDSNTAPAPEAVPVPQQDFAALMNDLIVADARSWGINRFVRNSVSETTVSATDDWGRPRRIVAVYSFINGWNNRGTEGSMTLEFANGRPVCMIFLDRPEQNIVPNEDIVVAYEGGKYTAVD